MKKAFSLVLSVFMFAALFTGCQQNSSVSSSAVSSQGSASSATSAEVAGITYPIEGNVTLSMIMVDESRVTTTTASLADTRFGEEWQKSTGIKLDFTYQANVDAVNLTIASGSLPDLFYFNFNSNYSGGTIQAIKDKVIYPITDLFEENAPDYYAIVQSNDTYKKTVTTPNGDIIGFPMFQGDERLVCNAGLMVRQDWLDDLDMKIPSTPEEFYNVLKSFKEEKNATVPFSVGLYWLKNICLEKGLLTSPYGIPQLEFYQIDGTIYNGYYQKEYKDVLTFLNRLYTDGLLDANFATIDANTQNANIMNGLSGITAGNVGGGIGSYLSTMADKDANYNLSAVGSLVAKKGDIPMSASYSFPVANNYAVITPSCENKKAAVQFLNYGYTEEGHMLMNFGVEGESYTIKNGVPTYTDLITKNPNGLTMQQALAQYTRAWSSGPCEQDVNYILQYFNRDQQKNALEVYSNSNARDYILPKLSIAEKDSSEYSKLSSDINTYISEMLVKFISGLEPLSNFDTYLSTLKTIGVETMIEMQQAALDEFNAR